MTGGGSTNFPRTGLRGMPVYNLDGATCVRMGGNLVLTIPEAAIITAATVPNLPRGMKYQVRDADAFLDGVAYQLVNLSYDDFSGFTETELRRFLRMVIRTVAFLDGQ